MFHNNAMGITELLDAEMRLLGPLIANAIPQNSCCKALWPVNQACRAKHASTSSSVYWQEQI